MLDDLKELKQNVPVEQIAEHFGAQFCRTDQKGHLWYRSPFREEDTPSFKVDPIKNEWHDFARQEGINAHGSNIDLYIDYHHGNRQDKQILAEAINFLKQFTYVAPKHAPLPRKDYSDRYKIIKISDKIWHEALKSHIEWRGLQPGLVQHIKQVYLEDIVTEKKFNGFCLENVNEGLEVSIPNPHTNFTFKTCIGPKGPTIIEPTKAGGYKWVVFEGMWDMETWRQMTNNWREYGIICLNGAGNAGRLLEYIPNADHIYMFLDNDDAGTEAELRLCEDFPIAGSMRHLYDGYKDLSMKWQQRPQERLALGKKSTNAPSLKF